MIIYQAYKYKGFSLIELLIVMTIVGILMITVMPSYQDSIRKSRRSDAISILIKMQLEQEYFRMINSSYAADFGVALNDVKSGNSEYYTFVIEGATSSVYTLHARTVPTSSQHADVSCRHFTLNQSGDKLPATCWK